MIRFQVRNFAAEIDKEFESEEAATIYAEAVARVADSQSEVITWNVQPNLPGAQPALRYYSCALKVFAPSTGWRSVNIFG
jgi:hypothetical protein